jgi:hypothetical protein
MDARDEALPASRRIVTRILELISTFSATRLAKRLLLPDDPARERFVEGLVQAGLPE